MNIQIHHAEQIAKEGKDNPVYAEALERYESARTELFESQQHLKSVVKLIDLEKAQQYDVAERASSDEAYGFMPGTVAEKMRRFR